MRTSNLCRATLAGVRFIPRILGDARNHYLVALPECDFLFFYSPSLKQVLYAMPRRNKKNKGKKKASIASSLVESMKNGTLGNDDLFASMQSKDQGPSEELLHVAEADVNNHAVSEVAKTKDATSRSGNTFEEKKPV